MWNGLERNKLDYILSDLLPVELSELFSYASFYSFLLEKKPQEYINRMVELVKKRKAKGNEPMFMDAWSTKPLKYNIMKGNCTTREMSVIQPFSAINIYLFMECYQKDILEYFSHNHYFSIRYHKKNKNLYYKSKKKAVTEYFQLQSKQLGRKAIQQSGNYFSVAPFDSIVSFAESLAWRSSNLRFKYYAKMDYKSCFDSIYSHSYAWIIERNVIDSKDARNSHLFITIDRILQNINGRSSNGIVVGPEFSRMIAEILLERIDAEVLNNLSSQGYRWHDDFEVYRYVDDIFVFANEQKTIQFIIDTYSHMGEKYRLKLNELKLVVDETPFQPKQWLEKTRTISDIIGNFFYKGNKTDYNQLDADRRALVIPGCYIPVDRVKDETAALIKCYPEEKRTIVAYLMSTLLHNIEKKKDGFNIFCDRSKGKAYLLIDLAFYIYAFYPSYDQTRKIMSIIAYISDEIDFFSDNEAKKKLFKIIQRYSYIFMCDMLPDLCDWFPFFSEYDFQLNCQIEETIIANVDKLNNPILWANLILYSRYDAMFQRDVLTKLERIIKNHISNINEKGVMLHDEYWYILIFHNCPYIDKRIQQQMDQIINDMRTKAASELADDNKYPRNMSVILVCDYLLRQSPNGNKPLESFFDWNGTKAFSKKVTFRTLQRSVFKKYKKNRYGLYTSVI